jgi:DNA-binding GntR family transcriptional regulator
MKNSEKVVERLQPVSKRTRVVATLKEAIRSGVLQSGDQIIEGKLAQQLGVGRGLIREALIELEHQGFVQRSPFSSMQVTQFSNGEARQIFEMRIEVEPLAFDLAGQKMSREQIAKLRDLLAKAKQGAASQSLHVFLENHLAYRRKVWELSGNRFLKQTLERLVAPLYAIYFMRATFNRDGVFQTIQDCIIHQEKTLLAFEAGNAKEAARIVRNSLQQMKDSLGV